MRQGNGYAQSINVIGSNLSIKAEIYPRYAPLETKAFFLLNPIRRSSQQQSGPLRPSFMRGGGKPSPVQCILPFSSFNKSIN